MAVPPTDPKVAPNDAAAKQDPHIGSVTSTGWKIESVIAYGGMSGVYLGSRDGREAAIKLALPEYAADEACRARFEREGEVLRMLRHPCAPKLLEMGVTADGAPMIVMERLEGLDAEELRKRRGGRLPVAEVLLLAEQVLDLLEQAHGRDVVHRDIKPSNIFITTEGAVNVLDFGVARYAGAGLQGERKGSRLGTPAYMAPEQALNVEGLMGPAADIFSVGASMYLLLCGRRMRDARTADEAFLLAATTPAPSLAQAAPDLPSALVQLVDRATSWDPAERFASAAQMRDAVRALLDAPPDAETGGGILRGSDLRSALGALVANPTDELDPDQRRQMVKDLKEFFRMVGAYLSLARRYGTEHEEVTRRRQPLWEWCIGALQRNPSGLSWRVKPYSFEYDGEPVRDSETQNDDVPYYFFQSGFRSLRIRDSITEPDFFAFIALFDIDPLKDLPAEDNLATVYLERGLRHVDADLLTAFNLAELDGYTSLKDQVTELQSQAEREMAAASEDRLELSSLLAALGPAGFAQARAVAASLGEATTQSRAPMAVARLLAERDIEELGAAIDSEGERWTEHMPAVVVEAWHEAERLGDLSRIEEAVRTLVADRFDEGDGREGIETLARILQGLGRGPSADRVFAITVTEPVVGRLFTLARRLDATDAVALGGLLFDIESILSTADERLFEPAVEAVRVARSERLSALLLEYLSRHLAGRESRLVLLLGMADEALALRLVNLLADSRTTAATDALAGAARSAHAAARLRAFEIRCERSPESVLAEVAALSRSDEAKLRSECLRLVQRFSIKAAAPVLVEVSSDAKFHALPLAERHALLMAAARLEPALAEKTFMEMANRHGALPDDKVDTSRILAVDLLGETASSEEARATMIACAKPWWWNTRELRAAAVRAMSRFDARKAKGGK